ncbi:MAG: leucine-rich repeat protein, partial [Clostridiales bacterium]|nr:leucine-rich repeat protein [Clostridiales bacterium]
MTFNEGLEEIGDAAFMKCSSLQNFVLPQSLTTIGRDGFSFCDSLTTVTI